MKIDCTQASCKKQFMKLNSTMLDIFGQMLGILDTTSRPFEKEHSSIEWNRDYISKKTRNKH